jgi:lysophospholipase L1-like esterase
VRSRRPVLSLAVAVVAMATAVVVPASQAGADTAHYYVALGDSLSRGYMPGPGDTDQGYADDLYAALKAKDPSLQLVKLGCSGETTSTMLAGGKCTDRYPLGTSQMAVAQQFLRAHSGQVTHLTLDIGANDVAGCAAGGSIDPVCVAQGTASITTNLQKILDGIVAADGYLPKSAGMTYYDPFLANWLSGPTGQAIAGASVALLVGINTVESLLYGLHGFRVADVSSTFHSLDFVTTRTAAPYGSLPTNVADICEFTFMCSQQNIHPTVQGYQLIAGTFARTFGV